MNLMYANSWTDYKDLIEDTDYLENALEDWGLNGADVLPHDDQVTGHSVVHRPWRCSGHCL